MSKNLPQSKPHSFPQKRRLARQAAMQALYQQSINQQSLKELYKQFEKSHHYLKSQLDASQIDESYFKELVEGVINNQEMIDKYISRYINRTIDEIDAVELSISRLATFEFLQKPEIPPKVILNEALELAKEFGGAEGHKFVNGVCDKIAREIRHLEINKTGRHKN